MCYKENFKKLFHPLICVSYRKNRANFKLSYVKTEMFICINKIK